MVQIIPSAARAFSSQSLSFISHMVQIIQVPSKYLIPDFVAFISHMVQIILNFTPFLQVSYLSLYIPHGSDNTNGQPFTKSTRSKPFISHMVQIIPVLQGLVPPTPLWSFISHMVQIIQEDIMQVMLV